ncbi:MAG TPA: hypothetical protein VIK33_10590 [Anaerolineae bacterium]
MATPTAQTASQIITDALVSLNVIREGQTPSAEQQAQAIRRMNQMMALWEADGRALGYIPIGTVTDVLTVPDGALMGIWTSLAILMAPLYGATVSAELAEMNRQGMAVVDKITAKEVLMELDVPTPSGREVFNIESG